MKELHVPGVVVGVIANERVVLAQGYGVQTVDGAAAVDADTLFNMASITKSFTTTAMVATEAHVAARTLSCA